MSKKSKAAARQERLKKRRAQKAAQKARYAVYALSGDNSKRKRVQSRRKRRIARGISHPNGDCGNVGCERCDPSAKMRAVLRDVERRRVVSLHKQKQARLLRQRWGPNPKSFQLEREAQS